MLGRTSAVAELLSTAINSSAVFSVNSEGKNFEQTLLSNANYFLVLLFDFSYLITRTTKGVILTHFFVLNFFYLNIEIRWPNFLTFLKITHFYSVQNLEAKSFSLLKP